MRISKSNRKAGATGGKSRGATGKTSGKLNGTIPSLPSDSAPRHAPKLAKINNSKPTPEPVIPSVPESVSAPFVEQELSPAPLQPTEVASTVSLDSSITDIVATMPEPVLSPPPKTLETSAPAAPQKSAASNGVSTETMSGYANLSSGRNISDSFASQKSQSTLLPSEASLQGGSFNSVGRLVPLAPPSTTLPTPFFENINIKKREIEVFYSIEDLYQIEQTEDGIFYPNFGWLGDTYLKKSAYVDVILSMQVGEVIEDLVKRIYLDTSIKSFVSLKDQALSKKRRSRLDVMYKATFDPFVYWDNMPVNAGDMLQLLEKTEGTNMSVTIRTGLDRDMFRRMKDIPFSGLIVTSTNTKDIIVASKIKNYTRTSISTAPSVDKIITDEIIVDRILQQLKNSRIFRTPSTIKSVNSDKIYDKKRTFKSFFSPLFLSEDLGDEVRGMFFFDQDKFIEYYKQGEPQAGVKNTSYVCNVRVVRSRVQVSEGNSDFSNKKMFRKFDDSAIPVVVLDRMIYSDAPTGENTRQLSSVPGMGYCFRDKDVSKRKSGKYKYEVEVSVKDDTAKYFVEKLNTLRAELHKFEKYITFTERSNNTIDPTTGLFTKQFDRAAKLWWETTNPEIQSPWRSAPITVARTLQDDSPVLDIDMSQYIIPLLRVCHPLTGTGKGLEIMKLITQRAISFYENRLAPYGKNMGSSFQGQTNKSSPKSGAGDYEKVTKLSYTFREYIDRDERKNLRAKYFDVKYDVGTDCLLEISSKEYSRVMSQNRIALLGEDKKLPSEVSVNGKTILSGVNSAQNDTSMTFLTPANFCMGKEKYVIEDFLEPPDEDRDEETANKRAQIYEDSLAVDNTSSAESFMIKYGISLIPLSSPETSVRKKPTIGLAQSATARSTEDGADNSEDAEVSRQTMVSLIGGLVDGENSEILLDNPMLEVSILSGKKGKLSITNFAGNTKNITEEEFNSFPTHIKSVLIYLSKTSTPFTLGTDSYIKVMADNFESDVNDSYDARFFYELFFKQIQKVQFLSGFQRNKDKNPEFQSPTFKDLTKNNLIGVGDGKLLCRVVPYESATLSYDARKGINGEPIESYFILEYKENTFRDAGNRDVSLQNIAVSAPAGGNK